MLIHASRSQEHKGAHMHRVLPETTQPPYWDPFHLSLLTTVVSCGFIGPHQTTSQNVCIPLPLARSHPPSLLHPTHPLSIPPSLPQRHRSHVCLSLAFISPAYWTPPLASEWSFDGAAARHKSIFTPFTYFHANKWFAMSAILRT